MAMNIKNEETHRLAQKLSKLTGESQTVAVTIAIRERIDRIEDEKGMTLRDRLIAISKDSGPRFVEPYKSMDHGDLLYDEDGLPK
jgi:antitoxin VapB